MDKKIIYDFDSVISRSGTHAEKYEALEKYFGSSTAEPFWVADMDLPTPAFIAEAIRQRASHHLFGYTEQYDEIFNSIIWWMKNEHDAEVEQQSISLSPSVVTTIAMAIQAFTAPGDQVAMLSPVYGPFFGMTRQNQRTVSTCPLKVEEGRFEIDFDLLEKVLSAPKVKLMLLCSPHNPGGRLWSFEELNRIAELCLKYKVIIFSDEIHSDIIYPPATHCSMLKIKNARNNIIVAHSIGKTFNCSGIQASFSIIPNKKLRVQFRQTVEKSHVGDINLLGKVALTHALSPKGSEYKRQLISYIHENVIQVCNLLKQIEGITVMIPDGTFLVWTDFRAFGTWQDIFSKLVNDANIALSGGTFFGPEGEGWFRINCAHPRSKLIPAVKRVVYLFQQSPRPTTTQKCNINR